MIHLYIVICQMMLMLEHEQMSESVTFLAPNGVTQMGKRTRLIRIGEEHWDKVESFLKKPTFVTLREAVPQE